MEENISRKHSIIHIHTQILKQMCSTSIIKKIDPKLKLQFVVEVGSFTGKSATIMGDVLKNTYPGSFLLCIDTWLGGM